MNIPRKIKILSTGTYLPKAISSEEIEQKHHLPKGWSERYSGVRNRHHVTFESNGYMGARAIESALENSDLELSDIDLIISAGATFDYPLPNQSSIIKSELKEGLKYDISTIDIDTTCLSFVTSFDIASKMMDNYQYKNIIIVSSAASSVKGAPNRFIYGTTKGALNGFIKALAIDYVDQGIRCNAICPGFVKTNHGLREIKELDEQGQNWNESDLNTVQGRICKPEEVASAVLYLASNDSSFVNGTALYIDNAWYAKG